MPSLSIRTQILLLVMSLVLISLGTLAALTASQVSHQLHGSLEAKAISVSAMVAQNVAPGLEFQDSSFVDEMVTAAFADHDIGGFCVCGKNGQTVFRKVVTEMPPSLIEECPSPDSLTILHYDNLCVVARPIMFRGRCVGDIWIAFSEESMDQRVRSSIETVVAGSAVVLALLLIVGSIISRKIVRPIRLFEAASERIRLGDMMLSIDVPSMHKEFHALGRAFNAMQGALKSAFEELRHSKDSLEEEVQARTKDL